MTSPTGQSSPAVADPPAPGLGGGVGSRGLGGPEQLQDYTRREGVRGVNGWAMNVYMYMCTSQVKSRTLTGHVERGEVIQGIYGDGCGRGEVAVALVQPQRPLDVLQHQRPGQGVTPGMLLGLTVLLGEGVSQAQGLGPGGQDFLHPRGPGPDLLQLLLHFLYTHGE